MYLLNQLLLHIYATLHHSWYYACDGTFADIKRYWSLSLSIDLFIHSFIHSFIYSFIYSVIQSISQSFVHSFIHSFVRSFVRSFVCSFVRSINQSINHSLIHSFTRPFVVMRKTSPVPELSFLPVPYRDWTGRLKNRVGYCWFSVSRNSK